MLNFNNLDSGEFSRLGIFFHEQKDAKLLAGIIREELEVRIGTALSEGLSREKLWEFDRCVDHAEAIQWLETNCPNYRGIVNEQSVKMELELYRHRAEIPGATVSGGEDFQAVPLETLNLTAATLDSTPKNAFGQLPATNSKARRT